MSFLNGPECSTAGNPLAQFTKHVQEDKTLQRDRLVGHSAGAPLESMRTPRPMGQQDAAMQAFLQQPAAAPLAGPSGPFAMDDLRRQIDGLAGPARAPLPASADGGAAFEKARMEAAFRPGGAGMSAPAPGFDAAEYQHFRPRIGSPPSQLAGAAPSSAALGGGLSRPMGLGYGAGMGMGYGTGMGMGLGMRSTPFAPLGLQRTPWSQVQQQGQTEGKGKGRMVELDDQEWEQQFAALDAPGAAAADDQARLDAEAGAAIERELAGLDRSVPSETGAGDFESIWRSIQAERAHNRHLADESDLQHDDGGLGQGDFLDEWKGFDSWDTGFVRDPQLGNYMFEPDNPFQALPGGDPFAEGVKILDEAGNLSLAALAFEAAVQRDPQHVEAWTLLGSAQAQNEKEAPAIRALEQALKLEPDHADALMGLAVSYTNEGYDATAYRTLERWLAVRYPDVVAPDAVSGAAEIGVTDRRALHERVTAQFVRAAQLRPAGADMDPDVQVGLGVLLYGADQFERAVDCFGAALASAAPGHATGARQRPLLWNRLGATLANSGRSEEAIGAYAEALRLSPNFVRARYNLGVSCINVGCYPEAAQHLLGALSMHRVVEREGRERVREVVGASAAATPADVSSGAGGALDDQDIDRLVAMNQSTNLYETLRRVFSQMERRDLADMVVPGMDVDVFRKEFDF